MDSLSLELFIQITFQLPISTIKQLALVSSYFHNFINSYTYLKSYITANYSIYILCNENLIMSQLKYIYTINQKKYANYYVLLEDWISAENNFIKNKLETSIVLNKKFITGNKIQEGDILNADKYYIFGKQLKNPKKVTINIHKYNKQTTIDLDKNHSLIEKFPLDYYLKDFNECWFYFNITPYLNQIESNLRLIDNYPDECILLYTSDFIHRFGIKYNITYRIDNIRFKRDIQKYGRPEAVLRVIAHGYFLVDKWSNNTLKIDYKLIHKKIQNF